MTQKLISQFPARSYPDCRVFQQRNVSGDSLGLLISASGHRHGWDGIPSWETT